MTGTAMTEAAEFWKIYKLDVIAVPTNKPLRRQNNPDVIYRSEPEKFNAIADEIERMNKWDVLENEKGEEYLGKIIHETDHTIEFQPRGSKERESIAKGKIKQIERRGRPVLVGTVSIERSELISALLEKRGIPHEVLNAKHHQREAEIVAQAGRLGAVTIATNMAGRGTDIILGGNPEAMAWAKLQEKYPTRLEVPQEEWDALVREIQEREQMKAEGRLVAGMGGLHILGSERHEARRIDLQLRGRCGRQGDPGSSRFYLSLEDDLMRIFAGEWVKTILTRLGMKEGEAIESHMVSRRIEGAQKKVEERNFEIRKNLLEYDEVMDEQRKRVYGYRQNILDGANCKQLILEMIDGQIEHYLDEFLQKDYGTETFAEWSAKLLAVEFDARDFRGADFAAADQLAHEQAERMAEGQVLDALEENLPSEEDPSEWNWEALAKLVNTRWHMSLRDRDLKQLGRDQVGDFLIERARAAVQKIDLSAGARFLQPEFGVQTACNWVKHKFGIELAPDNVRPLEPAAFKALVREKAQAAYEEKETAYPVMAGLYHFTTRDATGHKHYAREELAQWVSQRFKVELSIEELKNKQREEVRALLVEQSREFAKEQEAAMTESLAWLDRIIKPDEPVERTLRTAYEDGGLKELSQWLAEKHKYELSPEEMLRGNAERLRRHLTAAVEEVYRPEMRRMERAVVLQLLDTAWKEHLLAMDHLRSSVSLRGYAQIDPKVEYKREGMRIFEQMWTSVGEQTTDLIFKMEQLDEGFVGSTWKESEAIHQDAQSAGEIAAQQQAAIEGTETDHKPRPIRNRQQRVGRNDPCPCGSGKKFKQCCMKKG
jgi:preprotein translocase subunit SecA